MHEEGKVPPELISKTEEKELYIEGRQLSVVAPDPASRAHTPFCARVRARSLACICQAVRSAGRRPRVRRSVRRRRSNCAAPSAPHSLWTRPHADRKFRRMSVWRCSCKGKARQCTLFAQCRYSPSAGMASVVADRICTRGRSARAALARWSSGITPPAREFRRLRAAKRPPMRRDLMSIAESELLRER